jgi:hypothetical protein
MHFLAIPSSLSRSYSIFPLCLGRTLIEIAVYKDIAFQISPSADEQE